MDAYMLQGNQLPPLPDDIAMPSMPPPPMLPQTQFGMNGGARPMDGVPKFYVDVRRKPGGEYEHVEMVEIITPGDAKATPHRKVTDSLRQKYRPYYDSWKNEQTMAPIGTPLEMWPRTTPAMVHQLKSVNIFTVEQLAEVADSNLAHVAMGKTLRNDAKAWLAVKKDSDAIEKATAQTQALQDGMKMMEDRFEQEKATMAADNADLRAKLDALLAKMSEPPAEPKRGPGRPKASDAA